MKLDVPVLAILIALAFVLVACGQEERQTGEAMEMAVAVDMEALGNSLAEGQAAFEAAYEAGDAAALASMWVEDGMRLMPYTDPIRGREAVQASFAEFFEMTSNRTLELENITYGASGDLAYTIGTYTARYEMDGEPVTDQGKYVMVLRRDPDGDWEIVVAIPNTSQPAT